MEINSKRELHNIGINHSADSDYGNFIKLYGECTKKPYNSLTLRYILRYQRVILQDLQKKLFDSYV